MLYFNSLYNVHVRAVTRGQGPGICPGFYEHDHWLLSRKKEGKKNLKNFLAVQFPTYYSRNSTNGHLSKTCSFFLADSPCMDSYILGSLSNDDGDVNENGKKAIDLDCGQNNNFFYRRCTTPTWKCLISRFLETRQRTSIQPFRTQLQKKLPRFDELNEIE